MSNATNEPKRPLNVNRRAFLKRAGTVGAGAVVASRIHRPGAAAAQDACKIIAHQRTIRTAPSASTGEPS